MIFNIKTKFILSFFYSSILIILLFFLGPNFLINNSLYFYVFTFCFSFLFQFLFIVFLSRKFRSKLILILLLNGFSTSVATSQFFSDEFSSIFLLLVIFLFSIIPSLIIYFIFIFKFLRKNINNYSNHSLSESDEGITLPIKHFIIKSVAGKLLLKINLDAILCFEASDNYVYIHYLNNDNLEKKMDRISLKKIENILINLEANNFYRIHKSFIVNADYINRIVGKSQSLKLKLFHLEKEIPVSRSFKLSKIESFLSVN